MKIISIKDKRNETNFDITVEKDIVRVFSDDLEDGSFSYSLIFPREVYEKGIESLIKNKKCLIMSDKGSMEITMKNELSSKIVISIPMYSRNFVIYSDDYQYFGDHDLYFYPKKTNHIE